MRHHPRCAIFDEPPTLREENDCTCSVPRYSERAAQEEEKLGNVAIANGLVLKARQHFRIADSIRRRMND